MKIFGLERAWGDFLHETRPRQIFVTKSRLLARKFEKDLIELIMSDIMSKLAPQHFIDRVKRTTRKTYDGIFNIEDLEEWRSDLPLKFSDLTVDHFPLIITFSDVSCARLFASLLASF